ncbi:hypothetical protein ACFWNF_12580 [Streptomyces anulatus]|uniref:hypothetical protein n=1 Tax=Streptomyces anulatus TaxID=1892 RepID=UPI0036510754
MTDNAVEKARKVAEAAAAKLAEAEATEAIRQAEIAAQRAERAAVYDQDFYARWPEISRQAVESEGDRIADYDPEGMGFLEGLIRFAAGREKRRLVIQHAQSAEVALGVPAAKRTVPISDREYKLDILGYLTSIVEKEAERRSTVFAEELEAKRAKYISGGARR